MTNENRMNEWMHPKIIDFEIKIEKKKTGMRFKVHESSRIKIK